MSACLLDASAILALLQGEPGAAEVENVLADARVGAVNWSEVVAKRVQRGLPLALARRELAALVLEPLPFDGAMALEAARLFPLTASAGLSFAGRACLAVARVLSLPVFTADRCWKALEVGVTVRLIR